MAKLFAVLMGFMPHSRQEIQIRNVYGQRWFISEARGEIDKQDNKFAASEMRIVDEIPKIVLQRFAIWCAKDSLKYYEKKYPKDTKSK